MTIRREAWPACRLQRLDADGLAGASGQAKELFPDSGWTAAAVGELLDAPGCYALLASVEGCAAGLVLARTVADECEVLWIAVVPARRRRGIGRGLLQAALDRAVRNGAQTAYLEVAEVNLAARALYDATGFRPCGRRPDYYQDHPNDQPCDGLILRKVLERTAGRRTPCSANPMKKAEAQRS